MSALTCFGVPHVAIPPLEVTVVRVRTAQGDRFIAAALDDCGNQQPLLRDDFGHALRFISAECAKKMLWRWATKTATQMTVIYRGDLET